MDIKAEFTQYCGPSVLYKSHGQGGRILEIIYTIPALDEEEHSISDHLRNGLESTLRRSVRQMADSARNDAYHRTGHREADMARLLSGRTV